MKPQHCVHCIALWLGVTDCACLKPKQVTRLRVKHGQLHVKAARGKIINSPKAWITTVKCSICDSARQQREEWKRTLLWYRGKVREGEGGWALSMKLTLNWRQSGESAFWNNYQNLPWGGNWPRKQNLKEASVTCLSFYAPDILGEDPAIPTSLRDVFF